MSEWLKEHAWKACVREIVPRVRIPPSPPTYALALLELRLASQNPSGDEALAQSPPPSASLLLSRSFLFCVFLFSLIHLTNLIHLSNLLNLLLFDNLFFDSFLFLLGFL